MTGIALCSTRMVDGIDLRKTLRLRDVLLVASSAEYACVRQLRNDTRGIVHVILQRPMAGLAIQIRVLARSLLFHHVEVTILTSFVSCVVCRTRHDLLQRVSAIVAILPKAFRNKIAAKHYEEDEARGENSCEAKKVFGILKLCQSQPLPRLATGILQRCPSLR